MDTISAFVCGLGVGVVLWELANKRQWLSLQSTTRRALDLVEKLARPGKSNDGE